MDRAPGSSSAFPPLTSFPTPTLRLALPVQCLLCLPYTGDADPLAVLCKGILSRRVSRVNVSTAVSRVPWSPPSPPRLAGDVVGRTCLPCVPTLVLNTNIDCLQEQPAEQLIHQLRWQLVTLWDTLSPWDINTLKAVVAGRLPWAQQ